MGKINLQGSCVEKEIIRSLIPQPGVTGGTRPFEKALVGLNTWDNVEEVQVGGVDDFQD